MILHPSNVSIINEAYSLSNEEITYYEGMIHTFDQALKEGSVPLFIREITLIMHMSRRLNNC